MRILEDRNDSRLSLCREVAHKFNLSEKIASDIIDGMRQTITDAWTSICDEAALTETERKFFWRRQFLNPSIDE